MVALPKQNRVRWVRLTIQRAKERWANGDAITLVPCKCSPESPWGLAITIDPACFMGKARAYRDSSLWAGSVEETAWRLMYAHWMYYNTGPEVGNYAHYYIAKPLPKQRLEDAICEGDNQCV